jgi:hypothetical protein
MPESFAPVTQMSDTITERTQTSGGNLVLVQKLIEGVALG